MARAVFGRAGAAEEAAAAGAPAAADRDRALVEAARHDPARFEPLYRKYVAQVYSFAFYELGDHHAAEDATERTFLQALAALPRFEERGAPGTRDGSTFRVWLLRIARNTVANERRDRRRRRVASLDAELELERAGVASPPPDGFDLAGAAARREDAAAAWRAIARLPDDRRRAIVLRFVEELSTSEIAAVLGRSEGAVRVLLHRALRAVAAELAAGGERGDGPAGRRAGGPRRALDGLGRVGRLGRPRTPPA